MTKNSLLSLSIILLLLSACGGDSDSTLFGGADGISASYSAVVNGSITATGDIGGVPLVQASLVEDVLTITGTDGNSGSGIGLIISTFDGTGSYPINEEAADPNSISLTIVDITAFTGTVFASTSGMIEVTASGAYISGTFSASGVDVDGNIAEVTNGVFRVKSPIEL